MLIFRGLIVNETTSSGPRKNWQQPTSSKSEKREMRLLRAHCNGIRMTTARRGTAKFIRRHSFDGTRFCVEDKQLPRKTPRLTSGKGLELLLFIKGYIWLRVRLLPSARKMITARSC